MPAIAVAAGTLMGPGCGSNLGVITLKDPNSTGECRLDVTNTIKVKVKRQGTADLEETKGMAWVVANRCKQAIDARKVTVLNFMKDGKPVPTPVTCRPADLQVTLQPGEFGLIACKVNDGAYGKYKYSVDLDGRTLDPDVIIKRK
jgi:hypothetical protein